MWDADGWCYVHLLSIHMAFQSLSLFSIYKSWIQLHFIGSALHTHAMTQLTLAFAQLQRFLPPFCRIHSPVWLRGLDTHISTGSKARRVLYTDAKDGSECDMERSYQKWHSIWRTPSSLKENQDPQAQNGGALHAAWGFSSQQPHPLGAGSWSGSTWGEATHICWPAQTGYWPKFRSRDKVVYGGS